jgi:hypothetical protein
LEARTRRERRRSSKVGTTGDIDMGPPEMKTEESTEGERHWLR